MTKTKVLSIRLSEDFYNDLKTVAKAKDISMTKILTNYTQKDISTQAEALQLADSGDAKYSANQNTYDYMKQFIHRGNTYHDNKTDDELLYRKTIK
ncbi:BrnA antitoxin family protein [Patescibacteria group bacterium]|nr:BrnA antitoxin family protein [Patescibacteria group bacterium]MBU1885908.1 BrnA antitoxin family protein [Patescibacteria group bacterium]